MSTPSQPVPLVTKEFLSTFVQLMPKLLPEAALALAGARNTQGLRELLGFASSQDDWAGMLVMDAQTGLARAATCIATALATKHEDGEDPVRPLSAQERALVAWFIDATIPRDGGFSERVGFDLRQDLLHAICRHTDRAEAVQMLLQAGATPSGARLARDGGPIGPNGSTVRGRSAMFSHAVDRPHDNMPHYAALAELARFVAEHPEEQRQDHLINNARKLLGIGGGNDNTWLHNAMWSQEHICAAMRGAEQLERLLPIEDVARGRLRTLQSHLSGSVVSGLPWDNELVDYLIARRTDFRPAEGGPTGAYQDRRALQSALHQLIASELPGELERIPYFAFATCCQPVIDLLRDRVATPWEGRTGWLAQMARNGGRTPFDEDRYQACIDVMREIGLLEIELSDGRTNALHEIAKAGIGEGGAEWIVRLLELGLDPGHRNEQGVTPSELIQEGSSVREQFDNLVRSWQARQAASTVLKEVATAALGGGP